MQLLFSTWIWQNAWEHLECPPPLSLCFWTCTHLYTIYNCINLPLNKHYTLGMRSPDIRDHRAKCSPGTIFIRCIQIMKVNLGEAWFFPCKVGTLRTHEERTWKRLKATYWQPNHEFLLMQFNLYLLYLKVIIYMCTVSSFSNMTNYYNHSMWHDITGEQTRTAGLGVCAWMYTSRIQYSTIIAGRKHSEESDVVLATSHSIGLHGKNLSIAGYPSLWLSSLSSLEGWRPMETLPKNISMQ